MDDRNFNFDNVKVYADGIMSSDFENEYVVSLVLNIDTSLRLNAGGAISVCILIIYWKLN